MPFGSVFTAVSRPASGVDGFAWRRMNWPMLALSSLVIALCGVAAPAAVVQGGSPESIDALLEPIRRKHDMPALAAAVVEGDRIVALGAVGVRKYGATVAVKVNDQFHLGSDTKAMSATLIGMAVEEGKLGWDTTLAQALPDFAATMRPEYRPVTIEQLLAHEAGFTDESWLAHKTGMEMHSLPGTNRQQRWTYVGALLQEPPKIPPGTKSLYSNRSYAVAGAILERLYDASWEDLITRKLFRPLGMTTAGFYAMGSPGKIDEPWQHVLQNGKHVPIGPGPLSDNPPAIGPAGVVHCSMADWAAFVRLHLRGEEGHDGLLKDATIRRLHTPPGGGDYAGGWVLAARPWAGGTALTHAGSNTMNYCVVWIAPKRDFAVLAATNQGGDEAFKACDDAAATLIGWALQHHPGKTADAR
jgi:CubicO group peptidase (beta-lactamase class C family)